MLGLIRFHLFRSFILIANCPVCFLSIVSDPVPSHGTLRRQRSDKLGRVDRGRIPVSTVDAFRVLWTHCCCGRDASTLNVGGVQCGRNASTVGILDLDFFTFGRVLFYLIAVFVC